MRGVPSLPFFFGEDLGVLHRTQVQRGPQQQKSVGLACLLGEPLGVEAVPELLPRVPLGGARLGDVLEELLVLGGVVQRLGDHNGPVRVAGVAGSRETMAASFKKR